MLVLTPATSVGPGQPARRGHDASALTMVFFKYCERTPRSAACLPCSLLGPVHDDSLAGGYVSDEVLSLSSVRALSRDEARGLNQSARALWLEVKVVASDGSITTRYLRSADLRHATMGLPLRALVRGVASAALLDELHLPSDGGPAAPQPPPPSPPPPVVRPPAEALQERCVPASLPITGVSLHRCSCGVLIRGYSSSGPGNLGVKRLLNMLEATQAEEPKLLKMCDGVCTHVDRLGVYEGESVACSAGHSFCLQCAGDALSAGGKFSTGGHLCVSCTVAGCGGFVGMPEIRRVEAPAFTGPVTADMAAAAVEAFRQETMVKGIPAIATEMVASSLHFIKCTTPGCQV